MELRHIRYFVAAVEEGSLQAAANRLHVAQPALSRRIRDLELELETLLFERHTRGVRLTAAGSSFYKDATKILSALQEATYRIRKLHSKEGQRVRMGIVRTASKYEFARQATASFVRDCPDTELEAVSAASPELSTALQEGGLALALLYGHNQDLNKFDQRIVHFERYVLAVHPQHSLAQKKCIDLDDLKGDPLVWLSRRNDPDNHDALLQFCRSAGLEPTIGHVAASHDEQIEIVQVNRGMCLTVASTQLTTGADRLIYQSLPDLDLEIRLMLVWRRNIASGAEADLRASFDAAIDQHQAAIQANSMDWIFARGGQKVVRCPVSDGRSQI